jgi:outer membrane protein
MQKNRIFAAVIFTFSMLGLANIAQAQSLKIGVVDVITIVKAMPEAEQGDKFLNELGAKYQDTLLQMQKDLQTKFESYKKQKAMMPAAEQQKEEEKLNNDNQRIRMYQEEKFAQTGELAQRRQSILEPLKDKMLKAIEVVAKEEKISVVLDKGAGAAVVFADDKLDITFKVIDKIKRGDTK